MIRVRAYNVGFGDCFLVSFPDEGRTRHMVIDFGNAPGQRNDRFGEIATHIEQATQGHLDVLVVSHEHLDHIEGFYSQRAVFDRMSVDHVWMGIASDPDYYEDFPNAEPHRRLRSMVDVYANELAARRIELAPGFETMLRNNLSNADRLDYLRSLAAKSVKYLRRRRKSRMGVFDAATVKVLAPEADMSVYYHGGVSAVSALANAMNPKTSRQTDWWSFPKARRADGNVPPNLSARDWASLKAGIEGGGPEAVRTIDKAQNNSSLVFILEVDGKRLLFTGDAELESWEMLQKKNRSEMRPVDFLKVSHHGSHNGTLVSVLDDLLPVANRANATVMVSTKSKVYGTVNPVPDGDTLTELERRCAVFLTTESDEDELFVEAVIE